MTNSHSRTSAKRVTLRSASILLAGLGALASSKSLAGVSIQTPQGVAFDRVAVQYELSSSKAGTGRQDVQVTYSMNGTKGPFHDATEALGAPSEGTRALSASHSGTTHTFVWNSFFDLNARHFTHGTNVVVRVAGGGSATTSPFTVDNRLLATVAGHVSLGGIGDGGPATSALIDQPYCCHALPTGGFIFTDPIMSRVRMFTLGGTSTTIAGAGIGYTGDGGPATSATLNFPFDAVMDANGVIFIADAGNVVLRAINPVDGTIQTVATDPRFVNLLALRALPGNQLLIMDSGALEMFRFSYTVDSSGNVAGTVDVVLGTGNPGSAPTDGIAATQADLGSPLGDLQDDGNGTIYYSEYGSVIRKFQIGGNVTTVAGNFQDSSYGGDGGPASGATFSVQGLAYDSATGSICFSDPANNRIRRFKDGGIIETIAGDGGSGQPQLGGPAVGTDFPNPGFLAVDPSSGAFVASSTASHRFYSFSPGGTVSLAAGADQSGPLPGDGGPAPGATLGTPFAGVAPDGDLFIVEQCFGRFLRIDAQTGLANSLGGDGELQFSGIPGPLSTADLDSPYDLAIPRDGIVLIPSENEGLLLSADLKSGTIDVIAGNGTFGTGGDGGPAAEAQFVTPSSVAVSRKTGATYVGDEGSATVRRIDHETGIITTVAGGGTDATSENIPATQANLVFPTGVAVGPDGSIYICENSPASVIRRVTPDGMINTVAGVLFSSGYNGDGVATQSLLDAPLKVVADPNGILYITDQGNCRIRRVGLDGTMTTIMGDGTNRDAPDGAPALGAPVNGLWRVDVDNTGNVYVSEYYGTRVRRFHPD
jgi:hypothetical protein